MKSVFTGLDEAGKEQFQDVPDETPTKVLNGKRVVMESQELQEWKNQPPAPVKELSE